MIKLSYVPVLGIQFSSCNAQDLYVKNSGLSKSNLWKHETASRIVSYIPVLGGIAGFLHLWENTELSTDENMPNRKWHIARSLVECASLGFLFLVPDLIQTFIWIHQVYNTPKLPVHA